MQGASETRHEYSARTINLKIETQLVIVAGQAVALRRLAIAARNRTALAPKNAPKTIERASARFVFCACVIAEAVGHSSIATTQRYIDVSDELISNAVELV